MTWFVVDVEADGPTPMLHSMVSIGAVPVGRHEDLSFYGEVRPIHDTWVPACLAVSGVTREQHLLFDEPGYVMRKFAEWIASTTVGAPVFVSDNPAFDWQWVNGYFHAFHGSNPFGHSGRRIGDIFAGIQGKASASSGWHSLRKTQHTHHPVDDARGNAQALMAMRAMGFSLDL